MALPGTRLRLLMGHTIQWFRTCDQLRLRVPHESRLARRLLSAHWCQCSIYASMVLLLQTALVHHEARLRQEDGVLEAF